VDADDGELRRPAAPAEWWAGGQGRRTPALDRDAGSPAGEGHRDDHQDATYGSAFRDFDRPADAVDRTWWSDVPAEHGLFLPGRALAAGVVVVLDPAGDGNVWPWPARPLLRPQQA
jgi:hypothetical protein